MRSFSDAGIIKILGKLNEDEIEGIFEYFGSYEELRENCEEIIDCYINVEKLMYALWEYYCKEVKQGVS